MFAFNALLLFQRNNSTTIPSWTFYCKNNKIRFARSVCCKTGQICSYYGM